MKSRLSIDLSLAILGSIVGAAVLAVTIVIGKGIGLAATLACPCAVYLLLSRFRVDPAEVESGFAIRESTLGPFLIVTTGLIAVFFLFSVGSLHYMRPVEYFLVACGLCGIIGIEILASPPDSSDSKSWLILSQILLLSAGLSWGRLFEFSSLAGSDWYNAVFTAYIIENGHIVPPTFSMNWMPVDVTWHWSFPLMNLSVAMFSMVTGITSYKDGAAFSVSLFEIASLLFVYLAARRLFVDSRLSLLSALVLGVSAPQLRWGIWLVPQTLGVGLFAMVIYLLMNPTRRNTSYLMLFLLISILLTHTVSSFIAVVVIFLFAASDVFYSRFISRVAESTTLQIAALGLMVVLAYWTLASTFLGQHVVSMLLFLSEVQVLALSPTGKSFLSYDLDNIGIYLFYFMGIIGFLSWIAPKNRSSVRFKTTVSALLLLALVYSAYVLSIPDILPDRWFPFVFILLSFAAAAGLWRFTQLRHGRFGAILMLLLLCSSTFFMITNSNVADDAPLIGKSQAPSYSLLDSEMVPVIWLRSHSQARVITDLGYSDYFWGILRENLASIDFQNFTTPNGVLLLRNRIFERPIATQISGGSYAVVNSQFRNSLAKLDRIYSDGETDVYAP